MTNTSVKVLAVGLALPLMVGLTGCAGNRQNHRTGRQIDDNYTAERGYDENTEQRIEDSRTAQRVREALAAGADYKYDGVKVTAWNGVAQLSGFVNTSAQRNRAGEVTRKVADVKGVENNLTVKE
jgi:hyperosmotically inducible periplasmic protein